MMRCESGALMIGIGDPREFPHPFLPCEDTEKAVVYEPGRGSSPDTTDAVILDFPVYSSVRSKFLLFVKSSNIWYSVIAARMHCDIS